MCGFRRPAMVLDAIVSTDGSSLVYSVFIGSSSCVPKWKGWLQSERAQVSKFVDGLDFMIVLRHVVGLPLRLRHRHRIVAGRCCRPRGLVRIFFFVVGLGWPGFSVVVVVIVVVIGVGLVRSSRTLCFRGIRMPGLVDPVVFDFRLSGTRILSG